MCGFTYYRALTELHWVMSKRYSENRAEEHCSFPILIWKVSAEERHPAGKISVHRPGPLTLPCSVSYKATGSSESPPRVSITLWLPSAQVWFQDPLKQEPSSALRDCPGVAGPLAARRDAHTACGMLTAQLGNLGSCWRGASPKYVCVPSYRQPR